LNLRELGGEGEGWGGRGRVRVRDREGKEEGELKFHFAREILLPEN
jgi:hypothetical protein